MLKFLLLVALGVVVAWMFTSRGRAGSSANNPSTQKPADKAGADSTAAPARMLACAHCGLHVPQAEAVHDADGRPYCQEAHRLAGPR